MNHTTIAVDPAKNVFAITVTAYMTISSSLQIVHDLGWPEVVVLPEVQDLAHHSGWRTKSLSVSALSSHRVFTLRFLGLERES